MVRVVCLLSEESAAISITLCEMHSGILDHSGAHKSPPGASLIKLTNRELYRVFNLYLAGFELCNWNSTWALTDDVS